MRKIYSLVTLMLLFVAGVNAQSLADRYDAVGFGEEGAMVEDLSNLPEEGIAIQIGRHTTKAFMQTNDAGQVFFSSKLNNFSLFTFVPVDGAEDTYYLKSTATGKYLANPGLSNSRVEMVDNTVRASRIIVKNVKAWESSEALDEARNSGDPEYDRLTATLDELGTVAGSTFKFSNIYENDTLSLGFGANIDNNNIPIWSNSFTWNCYQFYNVEPLSAYNALQELFNEAYPDGQSSIDALEGGSDPGQVDQEAIDLYQEAYDNANALLGGTPTDEECVAGYEKILAAQAAIAAGSHNVTEGYFYISSLRTEKNATFIDTDNLVHWTYGQTWNQPVTPTAADAKYIWHFTSAGKNENGDDLFYIQNIWTGRYLGANTKSATQGGAVNKAIPTTETPQEKYIVNVHPSIAHAFNMTSSTRLESSENESNLYPAFHAGGDHSYVVWWSKNAGAGSAWRLLSIPEEDVDAVMGQIEQVQKNQALTELVNTVNTRVAQGRAYASDATHSADFSEVDGLVEDAAQLFTNAQEKAEGPIENAVDGNTGTFFHSAWQTASFESGDLPEGVIYHNIVADLSVAVENVVVKIAARSGNHINGNLPGTVHVYGANDFDQEAFMAGDYSNWEDCGVVTLNYNDSLIIGTDTIANASGLTTLELGKEYQYIRLDVISRKGGNDLASAAVQNRWFNLGEIRFYEATYDKENSINEQVEPAIMAELNNQLEIAGEELVDEMATQQTIDALQAAYDAYLNNLPDPQIAADLLAEARAQAEAAVEGDELGYFEAGAKAELEAALAAVEDKVKPMMTLAEVNAVKAAINAALAVFNSHLIQPEDGTYYHIISATSSEAENAAGGNYVYSSRNGGGISWGYGDKAEEIGNTFSTMWKAEKNADGSYSFRNALSGEYMATMKANSQRIVTRAEADSAHISLRSAKVAGLFNLVHGDGIYTNAEPGSGNVVTWGSANGTDNSAFRFVEATPEMPTTKCEVVTTTLSPVTLPVSFLVPNTTDKFYKVLGTKEIDGQLNLILGQYAADEVIVGGTPFFAQFDDAESDALFIDICDADGNTINTLDEITYAAEPLIANGLQGVLAATTTNKGAGVYRDGKILLANAGDAVGANSAYFVDVPATEEDGDIQILMENFTTSINNATIVAPANKAVYDLSGRRVMKAQKGLYIINGQKVLVK